MQFGTYGSTIISFPLILNQSLNDQGIFVDPCDPNPCLNEGLCFPGQNDVFVCVCPPQFSGRICEIPGNILGCHILRIAFQPERKLVPTLDVELYVLKRASEETGKF